MDNHSKNPFVKLFLSLFGGTALISFLMMGVAIVLNLGLLAAAVTIVCLVLRYFGVI